jgi:hypothetical protein
LIKGPARMRCSVLANMLYFVRSSIILRGILVSF